MSKEWFDGEFYRIELKHLEKNEIIDLLEWCELFESIYGQGCWDIHANIIVVSDCIQDNFEMQIRFEHFLDDIEKRINRDYFGFNSSVQKLDKIKDIDELEN